MPLFSFSSVTIENWQILTSAIANEGFLWPNWIKCSFWRTDTIESFAIIRCVVRHNYSCTYRLWWCYCYCCAPPIKLCEHNCLYNCERALCTNVRGWEIWRVRQQSMTMYVANTCSQPKWSTVVSFAPTNTRHARQMILLTRFCRLARRAESYFPMFAVWQCISAFRTDFRVSVCVVAVWVCVHSLCVGTIVQLSGILHLRKKVTQTVVGHAHTHTYSYTECCHFTSANIDSHLQAGKMLISDIECIRIDGRRGTINCGPDDRFPSHFCVWYIKKRSIGLTQRQRPSVYYKWKVTGDVSFGEHSNMNQCSQRHGFIYQTHGRGMKI